METEPRRVDVTSIGIDDNAGDIQKKKKKKVLGTGVGLSRDGGESHGKLAGKSIGICHRHGEIDRIESQRRDAGVVRVSDLRSGAAQPPRADPNSLGLEFPELLSDLRVLAVDPLFGTERDAPKIVLQVFCKFRTKVYLKSLAPPAIPELHAARVPAGRSLPAPAAGNSGIAFGNVAKDRREPPPSALKPLRPGPNQDDLAKAGLKRGPSDRLQELYTKKAKIMNQLKAMTAAKNAGISQKMPEGQQRSRKEPAPKAAAAAMKPSASAKPGEKTAAEPVKKQNPPVPPRASSPTAMVLKYPRTVTLLSIPGIKAKLAWFGPLVEGGTRVRWTSYTCQVIFQHKPDAQTAAMYVNNNEHLLGRNVRCSLFEVDPATLEPLPNPGKPRPPASSPRVGPPPRPGKDGAGSGGSLTPPPALPHRQPPAPTAPLKSILKKPGSISAARPHLRFLRRRCRCCYIPLAHHLRCRRSVHLSHHLLHLHLRRRRCRSIPLSHHLLHLHCRRCRSIPLPHHLLYLHLRLRRCRCCYIPPSHHLLRLRLHLHLHLH